MVRRRPRSIAVSVTTLAVLLIMVLSTAGLALRRGYAVALGPAVPSWVQPGDYIVYNQSYIIDGLTASMNVKDTFLSARGDMRTEEFGAHVPQGFAMPKLASPFNSTGGADLNMFIDRGGLTYTNATVVSLGVPGSGGSTVQAWRTDEVKLGIWVTGMRSSGAIVKSSFIWFEKDMLVKVREGANFTDLADGHYIVSAETMVDTNIPQLEPALTALGQYSVQSARSSSPSTTSVDAQSPGYAFGVTAWSAAAVVGLAVMAAFIFTRAKRRSR
jgi:hypothetical protein